MASAEMRTDGVKTSTGCQLGFDFVDGYGDVDTFYRHASGPLAIPANITPTTPPAAKSTNGPPLLPGFTAAEVWSSWNPWRTLLADKIHSVTVISGPMESAKG